jgi:hypothetical protein
LRTDVASRRLVAHHIAFPFSHVTSDWWFLFVQGINKAVDILEATQAQVSVDRLIGVRAFSLDRVLEMEPAFLDVRVPFCRVSAHLPAPHALLQGTKFCHARLRRRLQNSTHHQSLVKTACMGS